MDDHVLQAKGEDVVGDVVPQSGLRETGRILPQEEKLCK
jgi:hypothetical protein